MMSEEREKENKNLRKEIERLNQQLHQNEEPTSNGDEESGDRKNSTNEKLDNCTLTGAFVHGVFGWSPHV